MSQNTRPSEHERRDRSFTCTLGGIFTAAGCIALIFFAVILVKRSQFIKTAERIGAVITELDYDSEGNPDSPIVEFVAGDKIHRAYLDYTSTGMYVGQDVTIYYNPENPNEIRSVTRDRLGLLITGVMGLVFVSIGSAIFYIRRRRANSIRRIKAEGIRVQAEITDIREDLNTTMNGRHPVIISCRYTSPAGRLYLFTSRRIWSNCFDITPGRKVSVWMDRSNPSRYYVDPDSLLPQTPDKL